MNGHAFCHERACITAEMVPDPSSHFWASCTGVHQGVNGRAYRAALRHIFLHYERACKPYARAFIAANLHYLKSILVSFWEDFRAQNPRLLFWDRGWHQAPGE